jgi:hypothetical protein
VRCSASAATKTVDWATQRWTHSPHHASKHLPLGTHTMFSTASLTGEYKQLSTHLRALCAAELDTISISEPCCCGRQPCPSVCTRTLDHNAKLLHYIRQPWCSSCHGVR